MFFFCCLLFFLAIVTILYLFSLFFCRVFFLALEFGLLFNVGLVVVVATVLSFVARFLRQPLILAYIVSGIILGEAFFSQQDFRQLIDVFSQLGVAFLLFLVGLSLEPRALRQFGGVSFLIGISQIVVTTVFGFFISVFFGFNFVEALYIGLALTFSSTIIVVKYFSDKKELSSLSGRISVGAMLVQDFFSIAVILLAASVTVSSFNPVEVASGFLFKAVVFFVAAIFLGKLVAQSFFRFASRSQELLFLSSISWCLLLAGFAQFLGFSIEVGAFIAGVLVASFPYSFEIASKLKNLRDFFLVLFFVALGTGLAVASIEKIFFLAILLSVFVIVVQPLILLPIMFRLGYRAKTAFIVALSMAQISEFSIIFVALGLRLSHISQEVVSLVTLVAVITMSAGTLLLYNGDRLFEKYFRFMSRFEKKSSSLDFSGLQKETGVVFLGFGETAKNVYRQVEKKSESVFLVDFDPSNVQSLEKKGFKVLFADAQDPEVIQKIADLKPKIVFVSTDVFETNVTILKLLKKFGPKIKKFCAAQTHSMALELYGLGADFVVVPKMLSSQKTGEILFDSINDETKALQFKEEALKEIRQIEKEF